MNPAKTTLCCSVLCVLFLSSAVECAFAFTPPRSHDKRTPANSGQNDITIACPTQISYRIEVIPQWEAGAHGMKVLKFEDATVSGRILSCNYSANSGPVRDSSFLIREMPAGYICKNERVYGAKNWMFSCKRAVAPIKIKPKS